MEPIPNRFDRIVAILIQLQSRKIVKAKDLAERFGVTLRTIYRDIKSLDNAGVPIIGEAGTGYSIMDGYRLPPVMFSREEAGSFVAAEKLMEKFTDERISTHFSTAMYKVKSVLRSDEKSMVENLERLIDISTTPSAFNKSIPHALQHLIESMAEKKQILLEYKSPHGEEATIRKIEPTGIFHENQYWYVYAWCHMRNDYRQFRIDRIIHIRLMTDNFSREHPTLQELRATKKRTETTRIRIKVEKSVAPYLHFGREYHGYVSEKITGNWVEMEFHSNDVANDFARWFMVFADHAHILEPESLKISIRHILEKAIQKLELPVPEGGRLNT